MPENEHEEEHKESEHNSSAALRSKLWEWGKDVLALCVIPLVGWVINLSIANALRDEHILELQNQVKDLQAGHAEIEAVKKDVGDANLQMVRLEGKIDLANGRLDEIKSLLH